MGAIGMVAMAQSSGMFQGSHDPIKREYPKVGRNEPCPCESGKKYKKCCMNPNT